nr:MAG TPA: Lysozyme [Crassvirales sp.]
MEERYNNDQFIQGTDAQEPLKQWDDLSLTEKNTFIANAVKHGITNMEDIRKAYDELVQGNMNDYALQDNMNEEISPYNDDGSSIDQDSANVFLKGGYKPSRYIKSFISHMEGSSMNTNRSFDAEARDFWDAIPQDIRKKITQQQADALYSYSYNVGAGNFKKRVIPALQNYFNGTGSIDKVQRSMWASKDSQLRGLANRRAQERAMFAGSEVPVYYGNEHNNVYTPQYSNTWRDSRLGPVTSINMSRGLGVVDNNAMRGSAMLGPVSTRQDNSMMKEAINTLYDDSAKQAISPVTQKQESSLDRYNEIQDYLLSMSPFSFSNGGKIYADGGMTSTNGIYHVSPSNYENVLNTIANDKPVEVTLPDTTVTAANPSNYRSYYDPNGAGDFLDATTLGLFPNPFNLTKSASTFMQHPTLSSAWNTTKDALMFAGSTGKEVAFAPIGLMNLIDKDGVRKTYGLVNDGNYAGAVMSGLGDALNAGMIAGPIYAINKKLRTPKFISELDWSPESWFSKRTGGTYDAEDIAALKAHIPEYQAIEKAAKKNGTWLKMSDGSTWEGDPRSWVQLQSKDGQKLLQKPLYHGDSKAYTNIDGNDITPRTLGKGVLWASSNKYLPITYGNNYYTFTIPKGTPMVEINAGGRNWNNLEGLNLGYENTNDISWDLLNNDNVVRIKDVVDIGSALRWRPGKNGLPQVIPNEELKHYVNRVFKGDDYIFGEDTPRKSLLGNNGDFDFTKSNIYKGLIPFALPIGIGYSSLNKN